MHEGVLRVALYGGTVHFLHVLTNSMLQPSNSSITVPIQKKGNPIGLARVRTAMAHVALRRTKNATNIELVGKEHYLRKLKLPAQGDHKRIHYVLYSTMQTAFNAVAHNDFEGVTILLT